MISLKSAALFFLTIALSSYLSASASAEDSASDELFISQTQRVTKDALGKLNQAINSRGCRGCY
jgi:hypothetical protein